MARARDPKLDHETEERLRLLAKQRGRSVASLLRSAINEYLDREEGHEREKREDQDRWMRYLITGEAVTHQRIAEWLDEIGSGAARPCPR